MSSPLRVQTGNGVRQIPLFDPSEVDVDFLEVETSADGTRAVSLVNPQDAAFPYLRTQTEGNGVMAVHDFWTLGEDAQPDALYNDKSTSGDFDNDLTDYGFINDRYEWTEKFNPGRSNFDTNSYLIRSGDVAGGQKLHDLDLGGIMTVMVAVELVDTPDRQFVAETTKGDQDHGAWGIEQNTSNDINFWWRNSNGNLEVATAPSVGTGFHTILITRTNTDVTIYVDGNFASNTSPNDLPSENRGRDFIIGKKNRPSNQQPFKGTIYEFRAWDKIVRSDKREKLMDPSTTTYANKLEGDEVACYFFEDTT